MSARQGRRPNRPGKDTSTQKHILEVAAKMLRDKGKEHFHIADVAERANVGVPTIYYYFASINELVAHAQIINYVEDSRPVHSYDGQIAHSFAHHDEDEFWEAMKGHMDTVWQAGSFDGSIGILRLLTDIWSDEGAKATLRAMMRDRIAFWTTAARTGQELGWISASQDPEVLVKVLWASAIGHVVLGEDFLIEDGEARVTAFAIRAMKYAGPVDVTPPE
jgi:AcrR family transcriptional regulator